MSEEFAFDLAQVEAAVVSYEVYGFIEYLFEKPPVIRNRCNTDGRHRMTIVMVNLGNRNVKAAFESLDYAFNDMPFVLEAAYAEKMQLNC